MSRNKQIIKFISTVSGKNYSGANKYLKAIVEDSMKSKIARAVKNTKLF